MNIHKFGFGTARIHHIRKKKDRLRLLDKAYESGFRHFDTSPYYGQGIGQNTLYEWVKINKIRSQISISSKFGLYPLFSIYSKKYLTSMVIKIISKCLFKNYTSSLSAEKCHFFLMFSNFKLNKRL